MFAARDLKLFEKVGLAPEYIPFDAGPPMIAAAKSKSIDVAIVKTMPFLNGLSQGVDWVMIGIYSEGAYSEGLLARKDSGIDTPGDLKGKRIGYYKGIKCPLRCRDDPATARNFSRSSESGPYVA